MSPFRSSTGLPDFAAAALCYAIPFAGSVVFLALEKRSRFVLFHALQSLLAFGALMAGHIVAGFIPILGPPIAALLSLLGLGLWLFMIFHSLRGHWYQLPWAGPLADRLMRGL
ncbi:hypothetical protein F4V43_18205 [Paenibacillus spiritus]|uniref:DUF4870 domain-containing protein n=1 Tax=Paenibacillus spiritus TaxID=2496557 RepID=A0A5J5FU86_9BACL|nr:MULTISPECIES: hypothetical protein [Paenibacillus]KAA8997224.1 hypothetical protein F4V43_18205 [Paenibacillus spiritus]